MKRIYWMLWMFIPMILSAQSGGEYHIKGKLTEKNPPVRIYLLYRNDRKSFIDSAMIVKGVFVFTGKIVKPVQAELIAAYKGIGLFNLPRQGNCLSFYLAKGDFLIRSHDSIRNADIEDAGINAAYKKYQAFLQVPDRKIRLIDDETRSAMQESRNTDSFRNEVKERMDLVREERKDYQSKFIRQYPDSYFSLVAFEEITGRVMDTAVFGPVFNNLSVRLRKSAEAKYYRDLYTVSHDGYRSHSAGLHAKGYQRKGRQVIRF